MAIYFSSLPLALGGLLIAGIPNWTALPVILLSAMLQTGYSISLFKAYDRGPLSSVYPVARGSAPLFIFGLSYIFFDPIISTKTLAGIFVICSGLVTYGLFQVWKNREEDFPQGWRSHDWGNKNFPRSHKRHILFSPGMA